MQSAFSDNVFNNNLRRFSCIRSTFIVIPINPAKINENMLWNWDYSLKHRASYFLKLYSHYHFSSSLYSADLLLIYTNCFFDRLHQVLLFNIWLGIVILIAIIRWSEDNGTVKEISWHHNHQFGWNGISPHFHTNLLTQTLSKLYCRIL